MSQSQKSFVRGAAVLGAIGLVCKVIGAVYRIPMAAIIGTQGMAYYQTAYPVYTFLLAVSSAGLPVAISKMVSERVTLEDYRAAHAVFRTAMKSLLVIGLATAAVMFAFSGGIARALGRPDASLAIMAIAPALFFVSVISAYRGYFQGLQRMAPTAFSQLIEQTGKLGIGLFLAYLWKDHGVEYGAAGAVLGVTISEVLALLFLLLLYGRRKRELKLRIRRSPKTGKPEAHVARTLFVLALPIIIGACAMPLVQLADTAIVSNALYGLKSVMLAGREVPVSKELVDSLFGNLTGVVNPLINMPAVLSLALAMSLVPAVSASMAQRDEHGAAAKSGMGFKLAMLVGLPCALGFYMLATPIIRLLFGSLQGEELAVAGNLLSIMAVGVLFLTVVQTMTGILQGLGKTYLPVVNLFIGIAVKIAVSIVFIRMPKIHIKGAAIGTVACYAVAAVLDVACVMRHAKLKLRVADNFLKPLLSVTGMGAFVFVAQPLLSRFLSDRLATGLTIAGAGVLYALLVLFSGALTQEDMAFIPGGGRVARLMARLGLWKGGGQKA